MKPSEVRDVVEVAIQFAKRDRERTWEEFRAAQRVKLWPSELLDSFPR